jgi:hypothetical protein
MIPSGYLGKSNGLPSMDHNGSSAQELNGAMAMPNNFYFQKNFSSPVKFYGTDDNKAILLSPMPKGIPFTEDFNSIKSKNNIGIMPLKKSRWIHGKTAGPWSSKEIFHLFFPLLLFMELTILHGLAIYTSEKSPLYDDSLANYRWFAVGLLALLNFIKLIFQWHWGFHTKITATGVITMGCLMGILTNQSLKFIHWIVFFLHGFNIIKFFMAQNYENFFTDTLMKIIACGVVLIPNFLTKDHIPEITNFLYKSNWLMGHGVGFYLWVFSIFYKNIHIHLSGFKKLIFIGVNGLIANLLYLLMEKIIDGPFQHTVKIIIFFGYLIIIAQRITIDNLSLFKQVIWALYGFLLLNNCYDSLLMGFIGKPENIKYLFKYNLLNYTARWFINPFITNTVEKEQALWNMTSNDKSQLGPIYGEIQKTYGLKISWLDNIFHWYSWLYQQNLFIRRGLFSLGLIYFLM